jgi:hypothetical protein
LNRTGAIALALGIHKKVSELLPENLLSFLKVTRRRWHELAAHLKQ